MRGITRGVRGEGKGGHNGITARNQLEEFEEHVGDNNGARESRFTRADKRIKNTCIAAVESLWKREKDQRRTPRKAIQAHANSTSTTQGE